MIAWLRRGAAAAAMAGQRSELWPAGALAWTVYLGWLPLVLAVAPPDVSDVAGLAVQLYSSGAYPANVVVLAVMTVSGVLLLAVLAVAAEVSITRTFRGRVGRPAFDPAPSAATLAGLSVVLVVSAPVMVAAAWLAVRLVDVAPAVYSAPGSEATVVPRLAMAVLPQLVLLAAATLLAQVVGGALLRRALPAPGDDLPSALRHGLADLRRAPARFAGIALAGWLKDGLLLVGSWALLRVLWAPIGEWLGPGLTSPQLLLLLVGFVAIWLILLLVGGALHAFISAWWLFEGGDGR